MNLQQNPGTPWPPSRWMLLGLLIHLFVFHLTFGWILQGPSTAPAWAWNTFLTHSPGVVEAPTFFDAKVMMYGAEKQAAGVDPLREALNRAGILYNYPATWRFLSYLGLTAGHTVAFAGVLFVLFAASLWVVLPPRSGPACLLHLAILLSPSALNALGQGNCELLVVALCALATKIAAGARPGRRTPASLLFFGAACLKLYPAIALLGLSVHRRRRQVVPLACLAATLVVFFMIRDDIRMIGSRTPRYFAMSFGWQIIPLRAANLIASHSHWLVDRPWLSDWARVLAGHAWIFGLLYATLAVAGFAVGVKGSRGDGRTGGDVAVVLGGLLYVGSFGIGACWSHRALVLIPCLMAWKSMTKPLRLLIIAALWSPHLTSGAGFPLEQLIMWSLVAVLSPHIGRYIGGPSSAGPGDPGPEGQTSPLAPEERPSGSPSPLGSPPTHAAGP